MTTYTNVEADKINTAIRDNITAFLENISDPRGRTNTSEFVYQADPRTKSAEFSRYPIIYIEDYSSEDGDINVGGNLFNKTVRFEFHVVIEDDSADQKKMLDSISDSVEYKAMTGERINMAEHGIGQPTVNRNQRFTGIDKNDQPIIRREYELEAPMQIDIEQVDGVNPYA